MKTAIFLATGYEEIEALTVVDMLRRKSIVIDMISITESKETIGSHGIKVTADLTIENADFDSYDCLILPGGGPGTQALKKCDYLLNRLDKAFDEGKLICAICAAPTVLGQQGYLKGKKACCYPGLEEGLEGAQVVFDSVVKDGNIITSRGMGTAILFADKIIETIQGKEVAEKILKEIVYL